MKFSEYPILDSLKDNLNRLNYKKPTDIQYKAIPAILRGEDVLAIAQTGTGKTAAFAIPIIHMIQSRKIPGRRSGIKCLVMAPTHELAVQIETVIRGFEKGTRVKSMHLIGGVEQETQIQQLSKDIDILVATPGRMFDLFSQGHLRLDKVDILVLDEADHMLDLGFYDDIKDLIFKLPKRRQTLFFSATIDDKIKKLAYSIVSNPIRIQISPKNPVNKNISHAVSYIDMDDKRFFLEHLVKEDEERKILAFVRTRVRADRVNAAMARVEIESLCIHGDMEQEERSSALAAFKRGEVKLLIATDVSARGIDIPKVDLVVNYDLPDSGDQYVHRVGRTGRGREKGLAISFVSDKEKELLDKIHSYLGEAIDLIAFSKNDYNTVKSISASKEESLDDLMKQIEEEGKRRKKKKKK